MCCSPARRCTCPIRPIFEQLSASVATAEVQRQSDEWLNRAPQARTLRLLPPSDTQVGAGARAVSRPRTARRRIRRRASPQRRRRRPRPPAPTRAPRRAAGSSRCATSSYATSRTRPPAPPAPAEKPAQPPAEAEKPPAPGVELETRAGVHGRGIEAGQAIAQAPAETPRGRAGSDARGARPRSPAPAPSLVSQALGWVLSPIFLIGLGVAAADCSRPCGSCAVAGRSRRT